MICLYKFNILKHIKKWGKNPKHICSILNFLLMILRYSSKNARFINNMGKIDNNYGKKPLFKLV